MGRTRFGQLRMLVLLVTMVVGVMMPAEAEYHKAYRFKLPQEWLPSSEVPVGWMPDDVSAVRVITNAMEVVTDHYLGWRNPWDESVTGYPVISGTYCTRLAFNEYRSLQIDPATEEPWTWDQAIKLGWSVADSECRLRDLRWVTPDGTVVVSILAELGAVPGGGQLLWDPPEHPGQWVWRIWNDSDKPADEGGLPEPEPIQVHGLEVGIFEEKLTDVEIAEITEEGAGIFEKRAGDLDSLLASLRAAIEAQDLPPGWKTSLLGKLSNAEADKLSGDAAYQPPNFDIEAALHLWGQAAQHVQTMAAQIRNDGEGMGRKWEVPDAWADTALEAAEAILILPGTAPPVIAGVGGGSELVHVAATATSQADGIDVSAIPPGGYIDIVLEVAPGDAAVLHGDVTDPDTGEMILEWAEQVIIPPELDPPTPTIDPAPTNGYLYKPGPITLGATSPTDDVAAVYYSIGTEWEPVVMHPAAPPVTIDLQSPGRYNLVVAAQDIYGNLSEPRTVVVEMPTYVTLWDGFPAEYEGMPFSITDFPYYPGRGRLWVYRVGAIDRPVDTFSLAGSQGTALHLFQLCGDAVYALQGTTVARVNVHYLDGGVVGEDLVAGVNTAEWYDRPHLLGQAAHELPPPAWVFANPYGSGNGFYFHVSVSLDDTRPLDFLEFRLADTAPPELIALIGAATLEQRPL